MQTQVLVMLVVLVALWCLLLVMPLVMVVMAWHHSKYAGAVAVDSEIGLVIGMDCAYLEVQ